METETATPTEQVKSEPPNTPESSTNKEHKRSASYPALTIDEAYNFANRIYAVYSTAQSITREEIAHGLEVKAGSITREIAAAAQFGFLDKTEEGYKISTLFTDIVQPESETNKKLKMAVAFGNPKLYRELIAKFDNQLIPQEFVNTLIKHHSIIEAVAASAANLFIKSGMSVGVINEGRVLKYQVTISSLSKSQGGDGHNNHTPQDTLPPNPLLPAANPTVNFTAVEHERRIPIYLTKNKLAYLGYPSDLTENDIKILRHNVEGILLTITLEKEEEKNAAAS